MMTNRPDYAPDRRPGDSILINGADLERTANDLIAFHVDSRHALVIAALIEAGASAHAHTLPGTSAVGLVATKEHVELGHAAAQALRDEVARCRARDEHRHTTKAKADRTALTAASAMSVEPAAEVEVEPEPAGGGVWTCDHIVGPAAYDRRTEVEEALELRMLSRLEEQGATPTGPATFEWDQLPDGGFDIHGEQPFTNLDLAPLTDDNGNTIDPTTVAAAGSGALERPRRR